MHRKEVYLEILNKRQFKWFISSTSTVWILFSSCILNMISILSRSAVHRFQFAQLNAACVSERGPRGPGVTVWPAHQQKAERTHGTPSSAAAFQLFTRVRRSWASKQTWSSHSWSRSGDPIPIWFNLKTHFMFSVWAVVNPTAHSETWWIHYFFREFINRGLLWLKLKRERTKHLLEDNSNTQQHQKLRILIKTCREAAENVKLFIKSLTGGILWK